MGGGREGVAEVPETFLLGEEDLFGEVEWEEVGGGDVGGGREVVVSGPEAFMLADEDISMAFSFSTALKRAFEEVALGGDIEMLMDESDSESAVVYEDVSRFSTIPI